MKLLKLKAALHGMILMFSLGMTLVMLMETKSAIYPHVFCYICAIISFINVLYSAWLLVDCNREIEAIEARERR